MPRWFSATLGFSPLFISLSDMWWTSVFPRWDCSWANCSPIIEPEVTLGTGTNKENLILVFGCVSCYCLSFCFFYDWCDLLKASKTSTERHSRGTSLSHDTQDQRGSISIVFSRTSANNWHSRIEIMLNSADMMIQPFDILSCWNISIAHFKNYLSANKEKDLSNRSILPPKGLSHFTWWGRNAQMFFTLPNKRWGIIIMPNSSHKWAAQHTVKIWLREVHCQTKQGLDKTIISFYARLCNPASTPELDHTDEEIRAEIIQVC